MLDPRTLDKFSGKVNKANQQFCVWFYANNEFAKHQTRWNQQMTGFPGGKGCKYKNFWDVVVASLQHCWVLSSARLFDPSYSSWDKQKRKPRLSIDYILELLGDKNFTQSVKNRISKYDVTIRSLKEHRDNFSAHNDATFQPGQ
jgi:hypothetical protein